MQILNVFERTIALLVSQFRHEKNDGTLTNLQKLIKILCEPAQQLQDVLWQLQNERWISTALGVQLDEIGYFLGLQRILGESDADYRERLQFQIFINRNSGTPEQIIQMLAFLTKSTYVHFFDVFPAYFELEMNGTNLPSPWNDLNEGIFNASPAGVNYAPINATLDHEISFSFTNDVFFAPLLVVPFENNLSDKRNLLMMPYASLLWVTSNQLNTNLASGGFDELDFPLESAGQFSELIQKNGNFIPRRF